MSNDLHNDSNDDILDPHYPLSNFDSARHFDNYTESKEPAFEGWFNDDKLVKLKVDGQIIDFSPKKNTFNIIDKAVGKLIDFKYKLC